MSVVGASSVLRNEKDKWGYEQALTEISSNSMFFLHSAEGDINPTITFKMKEECEVLSVEVVDCQDCCHDRFNKVEVRVGTTTLFEKATSCGIQSYKGKTKYK